MPPAKHLTRSDLKAIVECLELGRREELNGTQTEGIEDYFGPDFDLDAYVSEVNRRYDRIVARVKAIGAESKEATR